MEKSDLIELMKHIKGLIFKHDDADYFYTGMWSASRGFLNLRQGGMSVTEYHTRWSSGKELTEDFGYKVGESEHATGCACEVEGILSTNSNYVTK